MATTFGAISRVPKNLEQTIAESPSTLSVSTQSLRVQQPFLVDLATLGNELTPATAELRAALPDINPALEAGVKTLARTPVLNENLQKVMVSLKNLALAPGTNVALNGLTATVDTLNPMMRYLGPFVTVCNDFNYFWTYLADDVSETTSFGTAQRVLFKLAGLRAWKGLPGSSWLADGFLELSYGHYFNGGYALHGAFWHAEFGHVKSHGCVNLAPWDAKALFGWTDPQLPEGWHAIMSTKDKPGSRVMVHERGPGTCLGPKLDACH